jgi:hypothetical protein
MIKVAIELNSVVRNINKQILKYYNKDIDNTAYSLDEVDELDNPFKLAKFETLKDRNTFLYIDYPYEIYGCAKAMHKDLPRDLNNWLAELTNYEEDDIEISFYSLNEEAITIQSSYFFLSKIGTRVRKVFFPKNVSEVTDYFDVIIASSTPSVESANEKGKPVILITNPTNEDYKDKVSYTYESLMELIHDEEITNKIFELVHGKNE